MFIDFMKTFLKDKEKEDFAKPPGMPEDMREIFRQRQRELAAERAEQAADAAETTDQTAPADSTTTQPKLDQVTLPPPPKGDEPATTAEPKPAAPAPKPEATPPVTTRPREAEPQKKKGKKGDGEPG